MKSLRGIDLKAAELTDNGLRFDRSFALIYPPGDSATPAAQPPLVRHLTIKKTFKLALFHPSVDETWTQLTIRFVGVSPSPSLTVPLTPSPIGFWQARQYRLSIFGTSAIGIDMGEQSAAFFTQHLGFDVRLVFIGGNGRREIPGLRFARNWFEAQGLDASYSSQQIKFADASPLLVTSTASEKATLERLPLAGRDEDILLRLRPNIHINVFDQLPAFDEDHWRTLKIRSHLNAGSEATIKCVYPCVRCLSINADTNNGNMSPRNRQLYGLLALDRRVNETFPST